MTIFKLGDQVPDIHADTYVSSDSTIIGSASFAADVSVWPQAVVRADNAAITIGQGSNIQDGAVLHVDEGCPVVVGDNVTIGHQAMLHGCTIGDGSLIGMSAVVLNNAVIGRNCLVGAGALVTEGKEFPEGVLIVGAPARAVRSLTPEEIEQLGNNAEHYVEKGRYYREALVEVEPQR
ncbi:gamma carbonic anhydrase family protein [Carnimonas nigrificans]|uniref:gamma carbonic anhydrase family protein n=1 Tax=Carnimonas nigrificans TaxID=64323 RepID=UPI00046EEB01|nr:gamma carbonic anhydrase family protein [Carnimonas nigrificans]